MVVNGCDFVIVDSHNSDDKAKPERLLLVQGRIGGTPIEMVRTGFEVDPGRLLVTVSAGGVGIPPCS